MRQRIIASCHLAPLDKKETRLYIEHRLKEVGWSSRPVITDIAFELIHNFTKGVPRRINVFCDRLLLYGYLEELFVFKPEVVNIVSKELASEVAVPDEDEAESKLKAEKKAAAKTPTKLVDTEPGSNSPDSATEGQREEKMMDMKKQIQHVEVALESMEKTMLAKIHLLRQTINQLKK